MSASPTGNTYFFGTTGNSTEVLRLSREGIWANPDVPVDEAAKLVLEAIDYNIKVLVQKAVEAEREWQGLTDEEYEAMAEKYVTNCFFDTLKYAKAIETKLKEKNHGSL